MSDYPSLGIISPWDFSDPDAWSGVVYQAVRHLQNKTSVKLLHVPPINHSFIDRALTRVSGKVFQQAYLPDHAILSASKGSKWVAQEVEKHFKDVDVYVSFAASPLCLSLSKEKPLIQITDSSFMAMAQSYFPSSSLSHLSSFQGNWIDKRVAKRSDHFVVASQWSANVLMEDLGIHSSKISVIPFGPGTVPPDDRNSICFETDSGVPVSPLKILFVASEWERKGGSDAIAIINEVRKVRDVEFTLVGKAPTQLPDWCNFLGRVSREDLQKLYIQHDLLLEPTKASAGGVVVTDAIAHGLPVAGRQIGGIKTIVKHQETGYLIEDNNDFLENAIKYLSRVGKNDIYNFKIKSKFDYQNRLNWKIWSKKLLDLNIH